MVIHRFLPYYRGQKRAKVTFNIIGPVSKNGRLRIRTSVGRISAKIFFN